MPVLLCCLYASLPPCSRSLASSHVTSWMRKNSPEWPSRSTACSLVTALKSIVPYKCGNNTGSALPLPCMSSEGAVLPTGAAGSYLTCRKEQPPSLANMSYRKYLPCLVRMAAMVVKHWVELLKWRLALHLLTESTPNVCMSAGLKQCSGADSYLHGSSRTAQLTVYEFEPC